MHTSPILRALSIAPLAPLLALAAQAQDADGPIDTEEKFRAVVADRVFAQEGGTWARNNSDGTMDGAWKGKGMSGEWTWDERGYCRWFAIGGKRFPTGCPTIAMEKGDLVFTLPGRDAARWTPTGD